MTLHKESLASRVVEFCRFCRENALSAGVKESVDALDAARTVGVSDREILKSALRAVLCSSKEEWDQFDELFESFWNAAQPGATPKPRRRPQQEQRLPPGTITTLLGSTEGRASADHGGKA